MAAKLLKLIPVGLVKDVVRKVFDGSYGQNYKVRLLKSIRRSSQQNNPLKHKLAKAYNKVFAGTMFVCILIKINRP